jgi:lipopolysaccharide/colanic/teichoic acid biosynthesis glycosyltransferase/glycosyltransferase involved in cell wall biosynthesis
MESPTSWHERHWTIVRSEIAIPCDRMPGAAPQRDSAGPSQHAPRLLIVVTIGQTARVLMKGQLSFLASQGLDTTVVCGVDDHLEEVATSEGVKVVGLSMSRSIRPLRDLWTLCRLWRVMRRIRPHIVNASTPKGGFLGMAAAVLARVPVRIYTVRGLRLTTTAGFRRWILAAAEWLASRFAHRVLCVSDSLADEYIAAGFASRSKVAVLGHGSSNGVDVRSFVSTASTAEWRRWFRQVHGISDQAPVIGFVGRLTRDKGVAELVQAFDHLQHRFPGIWLLLVGGFETDDPVDEKTKAYIQRHPRILCTGFVKEASEHYHAMDLFMFPSYREGFPNAVLEAQAAGLPVVGFSATGTVDAIVDGETGRLVPVGNVDSLVQAATVYLTDPALRARHGEQGRRRVTTRFSRAAVWTLLMEEYQRLLSATSAEFKQSPGSRDVRNRVGRQIVQRLMDLGIAGLAVLALSPLLVAVAIVVRWRLGKPVLFWQQRPGLRGRPFWMPKFRTMTDQRGPGGELLPDSLRLTRLGRFLRATSLDELPGLWSVLCGQMSVVGPRPLLMEYLGRYTPEQARRHEVKPGITGWAQVHGRNSTSWEERFAMDLWYVRNQSLWLDLKIIALTVGTVLSRRGISADDHATMPRFDDQPRIDISHDQAA